MKIMQKSKITLFSIVTSINETMDYNEVGKLMEFVQNMSTTTIRPKCLIICFTNSNSTTIHKIFLKKMWKNLFLDITILDIFKGNITIHQLNPFISQYKMKSFSKNTKLFPDKLKNLNGFPLKAGVFHHPPFIQLKRSNTTNDVINFDGREALIIKVFSQKMNFKIKFIESKINDFGRFNCKKSKSTALLNELFYNKIQFIAYRTTTSKTMCPIDPNEYIETGLDHFIFVVPLITNSSYSLSIGNSFYYSILLIALTAITSWCIEYFGKFDKNIWNITIIIQILFGMSIDREPEKFKERCCFMSFMIVAFLWSSNIFASFTDMHFQLNKEIQLNNMSDLIKSNLKINCHRNVLPIFKKIIDDENLTKWLGNNDDRFVENNNCIDVLLEKKNIACLLKRSIADWQTQIVNREKRLKYIESSVYSSALSYYLEPNSPYVDKFHKIYLRLIISGFIEKWNIRNKKTGKINFNDENDSQGNENVKVTSLLIGTIILGYSVSTLIFFGELLFKRFG